MRTKPADLHHVDVLDALGDGWGLEVSSLRHLAVGGGAHHWKARVGARDDLAFFVTVDDLDDKDWLGQTRPEVLVGLQRAYGVASALARHPGLEFVLAPIPNTNQELVRPLGDRYAVSLFPFVAGVTYPFGPHTDPVRRRRVLDAVTHLHRATPAVLDTALVHRPEVGARSHLEAAIDASAPPGSATLASAAALHAIAARRGELCALLDTFDEQAARLVASSSDVVLTHGEPHPGNVMFAGDRVLLLDWDTAALGPCERDLWMVTADVNELDRYTASTGRAIRPDVMTFYRLRWLLDDIASAARFFQRSESAIADSERWFRGLEEHLARLPGWVLAVGA